MFGVWIGLNAQDTYLNCVITKERDVSTQHSTQNRNRGTQRRYEKNKDFLWLCAQPHIKHNSHQGSFGPGT